MITQHKALVLFSITLALLAGSSSKVVAGLVYSDNFDSGVAKFTASAYFSDASQYNGLIVKSTATVGAGTYGNGITADASGSGFFLFEGTRNIDVPAGQEAFYISSRFAVASNTDYVLSYVLTNAENSNDAQVQAQISGVNLGGIVSAIGDYSTNGFQQFTFAFNSGSATTATLSLLDFKPNYGGNDFGVDNITISTSVPEPSTMGMTMLGSVVVVIVASRLRRVA